MGILLIFNIPCITKRLDVINLIATTSKETNPLKSLTMVVLFPWVHQGLNCCMWEPREYCNSMMIPLFIKTVLFKWMMLPVGEREMHEIVEDLLSKRGGQAAQKLTLYGTDPSWSYYVPPKRFLDWKSVHLTCLEKKMECKRLVDVLKQPKKQQQDKPYLWPCGDLFPCTMILLSYAAYK